MFRILSLDGGGIKGAFTASVLAAVEDEIKEPIGEYFDLIAGTSTGGIPALGLAFRIPARKIVEFYRDMGPENFSGNGGDLGSEEFFDPGTLPALLGCRRGLPLLNLSRVTGVFRAMIVIISR